MRAVLLALCLALAPLPAPLLVAADRALAAEVPLRQQIGQMIVIGFAGRSVRARHFRRVVELVRRGELGGVLYLQRNLSSRGAVVAMNAALREAAADLPAVLIAIDQEGGKVQRLTPSLGFHHVPSASTVARRMDDAKARATYDRLAAGLSEWGFNLNLGPVVDLNLNPRNPIIGRLGRAYSADPGIVSAFAAIFAEAHRAHGVATALKHFPGHGSSRQDSHDGLVDVSATWSKSELSPYRDLIERGHADLVMTAHVRNTHLQAPGEQGPASLSATVIDGVLRGELGFEGVVISDDLQMAGVADKFDLRQRVLRAVRAGTDILLFANDRKPDPAIAARVARILEDEAARDPGLRDRIARSHARILALKRRLAGENEPVPAAIATPPKTPAAL